MIINLKNAALAELIKRILWEKRKEKDPHIKVT
jgi:hypothetical protein